MRNKANFAQSNCNQRLTAIPSCPAPPGSRRSAGLAETCGRFFSLLSKVSPSTTPQTDCHHRSEPNGNKLTKQTRSPIIRFDPAAYTQLSQRTGRLAQGSQRPAAFARPALLSIARSCQGAIHRSSSRASVNGSQPNGEPNDETKPISYNSLRFIILQGPSAPDKEPPGFPTRILVLPK